MGISPPGFVAFLSDCYGGRASDKHIVLDSGFLEHLERDDQVMADRGFQINEGLLLKCCSLVVPPGARAKSQFTEKVVKKTKEIANLTWNGKLIEWRRKEIIKSVLPVTILHCIHEIVLPCTALSNLKDLLIR